MVKHPQPIRRLTADELFECDHFVGLVLKGLKMELAKRLCFRVTFDHISVERTPLL